MERAYQSCLKASAWISVARALYEPFTHSSFNKSQASLLVVDTVTHLQKKGVFFPLQSKSHERSHPFRCICLLSCGLGICFPDLRSASSPIAFPASDLFGHPRWHAPVNKNPSWHREQVGGDVIGCQVSRWVGGEGRLHPGDQLKKQKMLKRTSGICVGRWKDPSAFDSLFKPNTQWFFFSIFFADGTNLIYYMFLFSSTSVHLLIYINVCISELKHLERGERKEINGVITNWWCQSVIVMVIWCRGSSHHSLIIVSRGWPRISTPSTTTRKIDKLLKCLKTVFLIKPLNNSRILEESVCCIKTPFLSSWYNHTTLRLLCSTICNYIHNGT